MALAHIPNQFTAFKNKGIQNWILLPHINHKFYCPNFFFTGNVLLKWNYVTNFFLAFSSKLKIHYSNVAISDHFNFE